MYLTISSLGDSGWTEHKARVEYQCMQPHARDTTFTSCVCAYLPNSGYQHVDHKFTPVIFVHREQRQLHKPISCFIDAFCFTLFSRRGELYQFSFMKNGGFNIYVSEYAT